MLNLSLEELELKAKTKPRTKVMSIDKLLSISILDASEPIKKTKENFDTNKILEDIEPYFESKNKTIKDIRRENYEAGKILTKIRISFSLNKEDYYKPIRTGNAFSSNYIEYENNGDKEKMLSIEDHLDKIEPCLNDLIDNYKTQAEWKTRLTVAINFISSKDSDYDRQ